MIKSYFKSAWRSLGRNKTNTLINIGGLSIGMTASILIMIWVQNEMSFDTGHTDTKNIYRVTTKLVEPGWIWETSPLLLANAVKKQVPEILETARLSTNRGPVIRSGNNSSYMLKIAQVDASWFTLFHYDFLEGSAEGFGKNPYNIILTESERKKYLGNHQAIGAVLYIDSTNYTVTGVVKDPVSNSSFQFGSYFSIESYLADPEIRKNDEQWGNFNYLTFVKLSPNAKANAISAKITSVLHRESNDNGTLLELTALPNMHFETEIQNSVFIHGSRNTVYVFSLLSFLLLLIASINYVNLTTAKASLRAKEVSVRKIVGAKRAQLFYQFLAESFLISMLALVFTMLLVKLSLPLFNVYTGKNFEWSLTSTSIWKVISLTLLITWTLNSIYPALLLSSFKPLNIFRGITILKVKDSYFRRALVVFQFAVSVILIAGTIVIYRQMRFIQQTNPGYDRSQVMSVNLPYAVGGDNRTSLISTFKAELKNKPGIEAVSISNNPIEDLGSSCSDCADWLGRDTSFRPKISQLAVDENYQKVMRLEMKKGKWFEGPSSPDVHGFILNETAASIFGLKEPLVGQAFTFKGKKGQIIGVVKDFHYRSMHEKIGPVVLFRSPDWTNRFVVRTSAHNMQAGLESIRKTWQMLAPSFPLEYTFLDESFDNLYKDDQQTSVLILFFACIAVAISALGLFGLSTFAAEQRTKEIGIRKVLGASITNIAGILSKEFLVLVCVAILIAVPIANWAMHQWIAMFAYRTDISAWIFLAAGLIAILIAMTTVSVQALHAARANPVKSLRTE